MEEELEAKERLETQDDKRIGEKIQRRSRERGDGTVGGNGMGESHTNIKRPVDRDVCRAERSLSTIVSELLNVQALSYP